VNNVLGLARAGLIFTRSPEGTQLGWLTRTGQTKFMVFWGIHGPSWSVVSGGVHHREVKCGSGSAWGIRQ